jgi:hypothetical protein
MIKSYALAGADSVTKVTFEKNNKRGAGSNGPRKSAGFTGMAGSVLLDLAVEIAVQKYRFGQRPAPILRVFANQNVVGNRRSLASVCGDDPDHPGLIHLHETGA